MNLQICGLNFEILFAPHMEKILCFRGLRHFTNGRGRSKDETSRIFVFNYSEPVKKLLIDDSSRTRKYLPGLRLNEIKKEFFYFSFGKSNSIFLFIRPYKVYFNNFIRIFLSETLVLHNGFLLHSSGVSDGINGYLFSGLSGSGKTTIARRFKKVYSDDIVGIRKIRKFYSLFPTPFWGDLPISEKKLKRQPQKIRSVFFLEKGKRNMLYKSAKKNTITKLLRNAVFFGEHTDCLLRIISDFIRNDFFFRLRQDF